MSSFKVSELVDMVMQKHAGKKKADSHEPGSGPDMGLSEAGQEHVELVERMLEEAGDELVSTPRQMDPDEASNAAQRPVEEKMEPTGDVPENPDNATPAAMAASNGGEGGSPAPGAGELHPDKLASDASSLAAMFAEMAKQAQEAGNYDDARLCLEKASEYSTMAKRASAYKTKNTHKTALDSFVQEAKTKKAASNGNSDAVVVDALTEERKKLAAEYWAAGEIMAQSIIHNLQGSDAMNKNAADLNDLQEAVIKIADFVGFIGQKLGLVTE